MPRMSDTMTEGVLVSWQKKIGDRVKSGDVLAEVETDKATMEMESYVDGTLLYIGVKEGSAVPVNAVIAVIGKEGEDFTSAIEGSENTPIKEGSAPLNQTENVLKDEEVAVLGVPQEVGLVTNASERILASPLARKIAEEQKIDLKNVQGSGENGRIVKRDLTHVEPVEEVVNTPNSERIEKVERIFSDEESYEDVTLSQMRKTIARRLSESIFSAPHFYLTMEIDMSHLIDARKRLNHILQEKISFNDIIIKATAAALIKNPKVNASWLGDKIRYYHHVHIGVAIAIEDGLVVPVVKFANNKGLSTISTEVKMWAEKAKNKKLQPTDFEGNTFTISNLGMYGIEQFTAIINPPDACILAIGGIINKPVIRNGEVVQGHTMSVTLSCDHRVVDGATGAQFLKTFKQFLEEPLSILA